MIGSSPEIFNRRLYWLTAAIGATGFVVAWPLWGVKTGMAFVLGAAAAVGNVFLFDYLSRAISPEGTAAQPWRGRAFVSRYLLMIAAGYTIVKALGANPLAVILGLLSSAAAAIVLMVFELLEQLLNRKAIR